MMDIPMMDTYLDTLAGYICDEDKLVTYKWLSKELEVHVNIAKIILWRYWQKHKNDVLVATFMLIGNLKEGGMRVEVVKDSDLEKAKEKFEKIISEHIYSLQKSLLDVELLAGAGKGDSRYSAITCAKSVVLSEEELLSMRWGKAQPPKGAAIEKKAPPQPQSKKEAPAVKETPRKEENKESEAKSEEKPKKLSPKQKSNEKKGVAKKPVQSTKAGFGHLFAKAGNQQKPQTSSSSNKAASENAKKDSVHSPETKSSKSAAESLFGKGKAKENEDSTNVPMEVEVSSPEEKGEKKSSGNSTKAEKTEKTEKNDKAAASKKSNKTSKSKKSNRGTKRGRSQDSEEETKKRKRIIIASDSSEESANESADEDMFESPPPPSPKKQKSPSPPPVQQQGNKRKVRKLVDKTFMDEDGFLITKKEHVWESCSDEEPEIEEKKKKKVEAERPKETKETKETKESKMPVKKKQTSLMSFFKKA